MQCAAQFTPDVQAAEGHDGTVHGRLHGAPVGHVAGERLDRQPPFAQRGRRPLRLGQVPVGRQHPAALLGQPPGDGRADAAGPARDENPVSRETVESGHDDDRTVRTINRADTVRT